MRGSTFSCVSVGLLLIAPSAFSDDGPYFRMVPVHPQGANAEPYPPGTIIDEEAGTISFLGPHPQRVWLEVRFGGWESLGDLLILQFTTMHLSGSTGGLLRKAIEPCTPGAAGDEYCRGLFGDGPEDASGCVSIGDTLPFCAPAFPQFIDGDFRSDFLTDFDIYACRLVIDHIACGQTPTSRECATDDHTEKYLATLVVETTRTVAEPTEIAVNFTDHLLESFFTSCHPDSIDVPPSTLGGAVIRLRSGLCLEDDHCDDGSPCTINFCDEGVCHATPADTTGLCDDGNACTTNGQCMNGECVGIPIDCDDGNPCNGLEWCDPELGCMAGERWINAEPGCNGSLSRIRNNEMTLWFHQQLPSDVDGLCEIRSLLSCGIYGPDLSDDFVFDVDVEENALLVREQGSVFNNGRWYALLCDDGIGAVGPIEFHFAVLYGDANGDCLMYSTDLAYINAHIPAFPPLSVHNRRSDINGDGIVNFADLGAASSFVWSYCDPKPCGN